MFQRAVVLVLVSLLLAATLQAAVVYDFRQTTRTDAQGGKQSETTGKGIIDGDRSRIEFLGGDGFPAGSYLISRRGADEILIVDPKRKIYGEIDLSSMTSQLASGSVEITNLRTDVRQLPDHPTISGFPTDHYRIETTYRITVTRGPLPLTQDVQSVVEKWTTSAFGDVAGGFLDQNVFRTGNEQIDAILEAEVSKVTGLPLRQISTVTTTGVGNLSRSSSKIGLAPKRTTVSEILLSNVRVEAVPATMFEIPPGFRVAEPGDSRGDDKKLHVLSMEESEQ